MYTISCKASYTIQRSMLSFNVYFTPSISEIKPLEYLMAMAQYFSFNTGLTGIGLELNIMGPPHI